MYKVERYDETTQRWYTVRGACGLSAASFTLSNMSRLGQIGRITDDRRETIVIDGLRVEASIKAQPINPNRPIGLVDEWRIEGIMRRIS